MKRKNCLSLLFILALAAGLFVVCGITAAADAPDPITVKLEWEISDIEFSLTNKRTWNPDSFSWEESKTVGEITGGGATFTLTNESSENVVASVLFDFSDPSFETGISFEGNNCILSAAESKDITMSFDGFDSDVFAELSEESGTYGTYTVTINAVPTAKAGLVYTGAPQALVNAGTTNGGGWQYKLGADGTYSAEIPTATNAGTYTVYYKFVGGDNYNDIAEASVEVTVAKATQTITLDSTNVTIALIDEVDTITITIPVGQGETMYGYSTENDVDAVTDWQTSNIFTFNGGMGERYFFAKYAGNENYKPTVSNGFAREICFAAGTKITMADGTLKNIEDITEGEQVLTFNHETGKYEAQKVYIAWHGAYKTKAFTLHFDNGETLSIAGCHDLFEKEALKYVTISKANAEQFIGKHFYSCADGKYVELTGVTYETEAADFYSLYTEYNANCIAEGFLSVPGDVEYLLNIYEFNEDLTADHEQLEADIAKYGLYEYPENATYPKEIHEAYRWNYMYLFIGKGFGTEEYFFARRDAVLAGEY